MKQTLLSAALFAASATAYTVEGASFGQNGAIAPDGHIKNWLLSGSGFTPELLSNKIILTPPGPGKVQGSVWTESTVPSHEWLVDFEFRASGPDHANGQLQIWYTKENQAGIGHNNLYSIRKFTGLAILIDPLGGRAGGIRAFLNDGTTDYSASDVSTLPFGHCDYSYRNLGVPSKLQIHQDGTGLEVLVDGQRCFKAEGVTLPSGNYFGVTANTGDTPDSFELFKFVTQTGLSVAREDPNNQQQQQQQPMGNSPHQSNNKAPAGGPADPAALNELKSQLQTLTTQVQTGFEKINQVVDNNARSHASKNEFQVLESKLDRLQTLMEKISNEQRDYTSHFRDLQNELRTGSSNILGKLPESMESAITKHGSSTTQFVFIVIGAQLILGLGYILYRRRQDSPKKYL